MLLTLCPHLPVSSGSSACHPIILPLDRYKSVCEKAFLPTCLPYPPSPPVLSPREQWSSCWPYSTPQCLAHSQSSVSTSRLPSPLWSLPGSGCPTSHSVRTPQSSLSPRGALRTPFSGSLLIAASPSLHSSVVSFLPWFLPILREFHTCEQCIWII